jgi:hypothetical protein
MDSDLFLVIGIVMAAFAIPSLLGAYSEGRAPRVGSIMVLIASGLIVVALLNRPSGYRLDEVPGAFVRVIGKLTN